MEAPRSVKVTIGTNRTSLATQRYLGTNMSNSSKAMDHLTSGSRITKGADDAAGLSISEKFRANIRSMQQATRNVADSINLIQTAEGGMNEVSNILIRLRELCMQSASDTIGDSERAFANKEVQQLKDEITRTANSIEFNGIKLLNGTAGEIEIQVGTDATAGVSRLTLSPDEYNVSIEKIGIRNVSTINKNAARRSLTEIDEAITQLNNARTNLGAVQEQLRSTHAHLTVYKESITQAKSRVRDSDMAEESAELAKSNIQTSANIAMLAQANQVPTQSLKLLK